MIKIARALFTFGLVILTAEPAFAADDAAPPSTTADPQEAEIVAQGNPGEASSAPPLNVPYLQYGAGLVVTSVLSAGRICGNSIQPCIFGSGGGVLMRIGIRSAGPWYFGGAYELAKLDPSKLYRLAILQQLRFEGRYYIETGRDVQPVIAVSAGVAGYGNEWGVDTFGPSASLGAGIEAQITRTTVIGLYLGYRAIYLKSFIDPSHTERSAGLAQMLSLEFDLGARDPLGEGRVK